MCTACIPLNQVKADAFAGHLLDTINKGAAALLISLGHRTGLFDAMQDQAPATSQAIAERAGLNERYVREWLGGMAAAGVVELTEDGRRYHLPSEHAAFLTRSAGADNMAVFAQYIGVLGYVEDGIAECFHQGGGLRYSQYPRFHAVMAEDSGQSVLSSLFDHILPLVPGLTEQLEAGIRVADFGCGSGRALNMLAERFPKSTFIGYDLCAEPIGLAWREATKKGLTNVYFEARDLTNFIAPEPFDLITAFDAIHDQARPDAVLRNIFASLRPDGLFFMQDIDASSEVANNLDHPLGPLLYTVSTMHCMSVSLGQGGRGLGAMWGREQALTMLRACGFQSITLQRLEHDIQNCYYICRAK